MKEQDFLSRLFNLKDLPSTDKRPEFSRNAYVDIQKHRDVNNDWGGVSWIFKSDYGVINLLIEDDEKFIEFLCLTLDPKVRPSEEARELCSLYNRYLSEDNIHLYEQPGDNGNVFFEAGILSEDSQMFEQPQVLVPEPIPATKPRRIKTKPVKANEIKIFISYRRADSEWFVDNIESEMNKHFGDENVFLDVGDIPFGVDYRKHLADQIALHDVMLVVIGPDWGRIMLERASQEDDLVRIEVESALQQKKLVIPILVKNASMPDFSTLPESISELQWRNSATIRRKPDLIGDCIRLADGIKKQFG